MAPALNRDFTVQRGCHFAALWLAPRNSRIPCELTPQTPHVAMDASKIADKGIDLKRP
jgi:hypothetical protein